MRWGLRLHLLECIGQKEMRVGLVGTAKRRLHLSQKCLQLRNYISRVHTHMHALISRCTPALFIPGFQRAQWHKKAGVGAGRDSHNGTVIMTLEQPKKKPELLISLSVCARRAAQGWPSYHLLSAAQPDQLRCVNKCTPGNNGTPLRIRIYLFITSH